MCSLAQIHLIQGSSFVTSADAHNLTGGQVGTVGASEGGELQNFARSLRFDEFGRKHDFARVGMIIVDEFDKAHSHLQNLFLDATEGEIKVRE